VNLGCKENAQCLDLAVARQCKHVGKWWQLIHVSREDLQVKWIYSLSGLIFTFHAMCSSRFSYALTFQIFLCSYFNSSAKECFLGGRNCDLKEKSRSKKHSIVIFRFKSCLSLHQISAKETFDFKRCAIIKESRMTCIELYQKRKIANEFLTIRLLKSEAKKV